MTDHVPVTAVVFTLNEEANLPYCLESLADFSEVIVVDSFSGDRTADIARNAGAIFVQHEFTGFGDQRNWAIENINSKNNWWLILDADERVPPEMASEISGLITQNPEEGAFQMRRRFYLFGEWLRWSSLYPTWVVRLIHKERVRYENRGHSETQTIDGELGSLEADLIDENHKGLDDWYQRQLRYAEQEAKYELRNDKGTLKTSDFLSGEPLTRRHALKRLSWRLPGRAIVYFLYAYLLRLGFLDGAAGYRFCMMKASYQHMIVVKKAELKRR